MSDQVDVYHQWLGIPPKEQPPNHYRLLGLSLFESEASVIQHAADQRMIHLRQFQIGPDSELSQKLLNEVAAAKLCLLRPETKEPYDRALRQRLGPTEAPPSQRTRRTNERPAWRRPLIAAVAVVAIMGLFGLSLLTTQSNPAVPSVPSQASSPDPTPPTAPTRDPVVATAAASQPGLPVGASNAAAVAPPTSMDLAALVEKMAPSIVRVQTERATGSGFVVDAKGLIVTNYHVLENAATAEVVFGDGHSVKVEGYVAVDRKRDLALVRVQVKQPLTAIPLRPELPQTGEAVAAFGAPKGFSGAVSEGIVRSIRRGREMKEVVGKTDRHGLGYDDNATWIQTTAAVSVGNSGGPLIDMQGRVVGINTWRNAPSLNFAIAATEIATFCRNAGERLGPLTDLRAPNRPKAAPAANAVGPPPRKPAKAARRKPIACKFETLALPSGARLTSAVVDAPAQWQQSLFPDDAPVYMDKYPNNALRGVYQHQEGKLDGWVARLYPNGRLHILAKYRLSQLDGPLRIWEEQTGHRLFYGEYLRDRRHGIVCFFQENLPRLIQEWDKDRMVREYLVRFPSAAPVVLSPEQLDPAGVKEMEEAKKALAGVEAKMTEDENDVKRTLATEYRKASQEVRQNKAAALSREKKDAISKRIRDRDAEDAAAKQRFWRRALSGAL